MLLQISAAGVCKKAQMETSQTRDCAWKTVIDNKHKHTIIATLSVKKGSKFTDPDAQFPRGGALACARGCIEFSWFPGRDKGKMGEYCILHNA